ncbi:protein kinase domain-containing protein [Rhodopila globiformis]|uniref:non-specific serine/threonine protein kinase n=1 Tax=Rhodopila globiformis TaxID=1071 RepID=A0A2S6NFI8_RHOGL|nr:protein kinase [Rhodopila globiformis]PPQ33373.1 hypothetical protein CCS01_14665 [Rhodopila globiformis]
MRTTIERIGKYELKAPLARTPTSTVYEAWDTVIARRVALKLMPLSAVEEFDEREAFARFKRGAQAAGQLNHSNIVAVYDFGETDSYAYLVMEFVSGTTLKNVFDGNQRFALPEICRIIGSVLDALQYSHDRGVVHRDVKPANIMLTKEKQVKITDFGIARLEDSQITQAGMVIGTPAYMSPEQFLGENIDWRTDIYSAGVVLYQMLTGERPYEGNLATIMHKVLYGSPLPPSRVSTLVTPALDAVVTKAMARDRENRFKTASEFHEALLTAAMPAAPDAGKAAPIPLRPNGQARPQRAKKSAPAIGVVAFGGLIAAALGLGGYYVVRQWTSPGSADMQQNSDAARVQQQAQARILEEQARQQQAQVRLQQQDAARQQQQAQRQQEEAARQQQAQLQQEQEDSQRQQQALRQQEEEARQRQQEAQRQADQQRQQLEAQRQADQQARLQQEMARFKQQEQARLRQQQQQELARQRRETARQEPEHNRLAREQTGAKPKAADDDAAVGGAAKPSYPVTSTSGALGLLCVSVTPDTAGRFGLQTPEGMIVTGVLAGGAAERAGIRLDDLILKVKGLEISNLSSLSKIASDVPPGQTVPVEIIRDGNRHVLRLSLDAVRR